MKKILLQFADVLLSKEQMKGVKGGDGYDVGGSSGSCGNQTYYHCTGTLGGYNMSGGVCASSPGQARERYIAWLGTQSSMTGLTGYAPFNNCG